jgi:hypothetical protein
MKNPNLKRITSWEANAITGIPAATVLAWIHEGHLAAEKEMKGEREIHTFRVLDLALLLHTHHAGKHQQSPVDVPIGEVVLDPAYQLRAETKLSVVRDYTVLVANGHPMPPVLLVRLHDPDGGNRLLLVDGFHRYPAYFHAGCTHIPALIVEYCGEAEAFALALRANSSHGLPRSEADKRHLVMAMLARPEYAHLSSRDLEPICAVSHNTICRYRRRARPSNPQSQPLGGEKDPGTPAWIAAQITKLATMLRVTHPEAAEAITVQVSKLS